jgi:hypothetical protein
MPALDMQFVNYERTNTGRAYAVLDNGDPNAVVRLESRMENKPDHPEATPLGYVDLLYITTPPLSRKQAKELSVHLARFARSGSILKRGS